MRASVDNPELLQLYGGRPQLVAALAWAIGCSLAALAGILLAPVVGLQYYDLTLLVISAYAAAMLGKLTNLPMTYIGAMALGIAQSYVVGYLQNIPFHNKVPGLAAVIPTLFLFAILVLLPQAPLRIGQVKGIVSAPVPTLGRAAGLGSGAHRRRHGALAVALSDSNLLLVGTAATYAIVMLSLVLLTGYGGYVSLAQFTFAGVGAVAYAKIDQPNLFGLLIAVLVAAAVGALVAIPVLRLTGLYLALGDAGVCPAHGQAGVPVRHRVRVQQPAQGRTALDLRTEARRHRGVRRHDDGLLRAHRAGRARRTPRTARPDPGRRARQPGRRRNARHRHALAPGRPVRRRPPESPVSPARCSPDSGAPSWPFDFQFFASLLLLLMAVVWGVTSVTGAALGGIFLMYLPVAQSDSPSIAGLLFLLLGVGAVILARDPNGLANKLFQAPGWLRDTALPAIADRLPAVALRLPERRSSDI